jgi:hypothetical protein
VSLPGRERTLDEYAALFSAAGLRLQEATEIQSATIVMQAVAA